MSTSSPESESAPKGAPGEQRPYGVQLTFQIPHAASIGSLENVSIPLPSGEILVIRPARSASWEGGRKFHIGLDGFASAGAAESEGRRLAQSMLLLAASLDFGLRLVYRGGQPATVCGRFRPEGLSDWNPGEGVAGWSAPVVLDEFLSAFRVGLLDPTLTLSMELYCSALLEANERARFVAVVSALDPLARREALGQGVPALVAGMLASLDAAADIAPGLKESLRGRIGQLAHESSRQALLRLADTWFPDRPDWRRQIDHAYGLRGELLQNGSLAGLDSDLDGETEKVANILRSIYSRASGRPFRVPPRA